MCCGEYQLRNNIVAFSVILCYYEINQNPETMPEIPYTREELSFFELQDEQLERGTFWKTFYEACAKARAIMDTALIF